MMSEKEVIREAVRSEFDKLLLFEEKYGSDDEKTKIQRAKWDALDYIWFTLYGVKY